MITIISATNRTNSKTKSIAQYYYDTLKTMGQEVNIITLENLPFEVFTSEAYTGKENALGKAFIDIQDEKMIPAKKFVIVVPEYNGSFAGILKLFLDICSVRRAKETFKNKKIALVGVADGRAGNLRGLEHLTGIANHLGMIVLPNKLPISGVGKLLDKNGQLMSEDTMKVVQGQINDLLAL